MKNRLLLVASVLLILAGCAPDIIENRLFHQADLHDDLWQEDSSAVEQVFFIDTDTITTLICEKGTKLIIPAGAFVLDEYPDRPVQAKVELRVIEVYEPAEMFRYHLNTQHESGQLLAAAGMIYLEAYAGGERLQIKEGKEFLLGFPKNIGPQEVSLWKALEPAEAAMRWQKEESSFNFNPEQAILDTYFAGNAKEEVAVVLEAPAQAPITPVAANVARKGTGQNNDAAQNYPLVLLKDANISTHISLLEGYHDYYYFRTEQLDWLSCGRFMDPDTVADADTIADTDADAQVPKLRLNISGFPANALYYLVFEEPDAMMVMVGHRKAMEPAENNPVFEQLPPDRKATLITVYNKEGLYYMARQEVTFSPGLSIQLQLKPQQLEKAAIRSYLLGLGKKEKGIASR